METGFEGATPILRVENLAKSVAFYVEKLGFALDWQTPEVFASVTRGRCTLFLCEKDQGHAGGWVWIGVEDAAALHDDLRAKGVTIRHPPTNYGWAYEMQVEDLDGNVLRMGSEPKKGEAAGEWLDMHGERRTPRPGGGWEPGGSSG
jgi:catechol 2,3-dioxygenase-like lactoylglutathione lyase family enzyme